MKRIFYNYPTPEVLHDARFAGTNYRQREYIKRKSARWVTKWKQLQPHERQHILQQLMQETRPELLDYGYHRHPQRGGQVRRCSTSGSLSGRAAHRAGPDVAGQ